MIQQQADGPHVSLLPTMEELNFTHGGSDLKMFKLDLVVKKQPDPSVQSVGYSARQPSWIPKMPMRQR